MYPRFGFPGCFFAVAVVIAIVFPLWKICTKAGYPGALSLLFFVPIVNAIMIWVFALSEWPIEQQLRAARTTPGSPIS